MIDGARHFDLHVHGRLVPHRHLEHGRNRRFDDGVLGKQLAADDSSAAAHVQDAPLLQSATGLDPARAQVAMRTRDAAGSTPGVARACSGPTVDPKASADRDVKPAANLAHLEATRPTSGPGPHAPEAPHVGALSVPSPSTEQK